MTSPKDQELLDAAKAGNAVVVEQCLKEGANIRAMDGTGSMAVHLAARYNKDAAVINTLIAFDKSIVNAVRVGGCTIDGGHKSCSAPGGEEPLHMVGYNQTGGDLPTIARALLNAGADVDAKDNEDHTPLHIIARLDTMPDKELATVGPVGMGSAARTEAVAKLMRPYSKQSAALCSALLEFHPKLNARDFHDHTPLHHACMYCNISVVELLLARGARTFSMNENLTIDAILSAPSDDVGNWNRIIIEEIHAMIDASRKPSQIVKRTANAIGGWAQRNFNDPSVVLGDKSR